tara:strand:+ start:845 stop:1417 length:573 start_codon:yes stop_codon:yes gene_type:complete
MDFLKDIGTGFSDLISGFTSFFEDKQIDKDYISVDEERFGSGDEFTTTSLEGIKKEEKENEGSSFFDFIDEVADSKFGKFAQGAAGALLKQPDSSSRSVSSRRPVPVAPQARTTGPNPGFNYGRFVAEIVDPGSGGRANSAMQSLIQGALAKEQLASQVATQIVDAKEAGTRLAPMQLDKGKIVLTRRLA